MSTRSTDKQAREKNSSTPRGSLLVTSVAGSHGIGIFKNIQSGLNLQSAQLAVLELAKGKDAIALASKDEVQATLEAISQAVSEGEFDTLLSERLVPIGKRNNKQK